jgi:hypothetical protein
LGIAEKSIAVSNTREVRVGIGVCETRRAIAARLYVLSNYDNRVCAMLPCSSYSRFEGGYGRHAATLSLTQRSGDETADYGGAGAVEANTADGGVLRGTNTPCVPQKENS